MTPSHPASDQPGDPAPAAPARSDDPQPIEVTSPRRAAARRVGDQGHAAAADAALIAVADPILGARLSVRLAKLGLRPIVVGSARAAAAVHQADAVGLLIADDQLPDGAGVELCQALRDLRPQAPMTTIVIAEHAQPARIVAALKQGVDDLLTGVGEDQAVLIARVESLLARRRPPAGPVQPDPADAEKAITVGQITIRPWAFNVLVDDHRIDLTVTQFRLLLLLARRPGHIVTPEQIQAHLAERGSNLRESSVKSHVYFLRQKLGPAGDQIENIRRVGYRLREF